MNSEAKKLIAKVANSPGITHEDIMRYAAELKAKNPNQLIDEALAEVLLEKSGANMSDPFVDMINKANKDNPIGIDKYIIDPDNAKSPRAKELLSKLNPDEYAASFFDKNDMTPLHISLKKPKSEYGKAMGLVTDSHENDHILNALTDPSFMSKGDAGQIGHHIGKGTSETQSLISNARDLPMDEKILQVATKRANKLGIGKKLAQEIPGIAGLAAGLGMASYSGESQAAIPILGEANNVGMSAADESAMLEQIDARKSYSPDMPEKDMARWNKIRNQLSK